MQVRKNMAFEKKKDNIAKPIHSKNLSPTSEKCNIKRQPNNLLDKGKEVVLVENKVDDDSIRPLSSSDENYIVFSFREDGELDVVYDCYSAKCEAHSSNVHGNHQSSRRVNRKVCTNCHNLQIFFFSSVLNRDRVAILDNTMNYD